jgi:hypothetical protein
MHIQAHARTHTRTHTHTHTHTQAPAGKLVECDEKSAKLQRVLFPVSELAGAGRLRHCEEARANKLVQHLHCSDRPQLAASATGEDALMLCLMAVEPKRKRKRKTLLSQTTPHHALDNLRHELVKGFARVAGKLGRPWAVSVGARNNSSFQPEMKARGS